VIRDLLEKAIAADRLHLKPIDANEVVQPQASGFNHRRDGLAYRLYLATSKGKWYPQKRVQPKLQHRDKWLQGRHEMRMILAQESHLAFQKALKADDFSVFVNHMEPFIHRYRIVSDGPLWKRLARRSQRFVKILFEKLAVLKG